MTFDILSYVWVWWGNGLSVCVASIRTGQATKNVSSVLVNRWGKCVWKLRVAEESGSRTVPFRVKNKD